MKYLYEDLDRQQGIDIEAAIAVRRLKKEKLPWSDARHPVWRVTTFACLIGSAICASIAIVSVGYMFYTG